MGKLVLFVCTNGFFLQRGVMEAILAAGELNTAFVPLLAEERFRFPGLTFRDDHREIAKAVSDDRELVLDLAENIFKEIAVVFQPEHYSSTEMILATKAHEIFTRCNRDNLSKTLKNVGARNDNDDAAL